MIDYTKILICGVDIDRLMSLKLLDFKGDYSGSTGAYDDTKFTAKFHHCKIVIYQLLDENKKRIRATVIFSGSIHKMWNSIHGIFAPNYNPHKPYKGYNGNQFEVSDVLEMRCFLEELFDCSSKQMVFRSVEFGLNTLLEFAPKNFMKGLLYFHNVAFEFSHNRNSAQAHLQRYILKIYDKSHQYGIKHPVMRIELKFLKMIELERFGIKCFSDITEEKLNTVLKYLCNQFEEVMYYDYTVRVMELKNCDQQNLHKFSNVNFWLDTIPSRRDRPKKHLDNIIKNHSENLKGQIIDLLKRKMPNN